MKSLIIVDLENPYKNGIERQFALAAKHKDPNISDYHAVIYCDDPDNNIITKLNHSFSSKIEILRSIVF